MGHMSGLIGRLISHLAQKYIVEALGRSPAFQQFAVGSAAWAKRLVETPSKALKSKVHSAGRTAKQQPKQQPKQQQQQAESSTEGAGFAAMRRRAAAFGSALADEVQKDLGLAAKAKSGR